MTLPTTTTSAKAGKKKWMKSAIVINGVVTWGGIAHTSAAVRAMVVRSRLGIGSGTMALAVFGRKKV